MADLDRQNVVREAKSALRANAHGSFEEQAPHLCSLLESLPVLGPNTAVLQAALCGGAEEMGADEVLKRLKESWVCHRSSQEGAIHVEVGREMEQLILTFHMYLWGRTTEMRRLEIVRKGEERYLYWDRGQLRSARQGTNPSLCDPFARNRCPSPLDTSRGFPRSIDLL